MEFNYSTAKLQELVDHCQELGVPKGRKVAKSWGTAMLRQILNLHYGGDLELKPSKQHCKTCFNDGICKQGVFGTKDGKYCYCASHRKEHHINFKDRTCAEPGCTTIPNYGKKGKRATHCVVHKPEEYVNVKSRTCVETNCEKQPWFGYPGKKPERCAKHRLKDQVNVNDKLCEEPGCGKIPHFGKPGGKPRFCEKHCLKGHKNVRSSKCQHPDCEKAPAFGEQNGSPKWCSAHKKKGNVNLRKKKCAHDGCETEPSYGVLGGKAVYCKAHKKKDYVNVKSKICEEPNCNTQPNYGELGGPARWCAKHKGKNDVNVRSRQCSKPGCTKQPSYGRPGGIAKTCSAHRKGKYVDLHHKRCEEPDCKELPAYGEPGSKPRFCRSHRLEGHVNVYKKVCIHPKCSTMAWCKNEFGKILFCAAHQYTFVKKAIENQTIPWGYLSQATKDQLDEEYDDVDEPEKPQNVMCVMSGCRNVPIYCAPDEDDPSICERHKKKMDPKGKYYVTMGNKCCEENCYQRAILDECCYVHHPDQAMIKRMFKICRYCDIDDTSDYVCKECRQNREKKEIGYVLKLSHAPSYAGRTEKVTYNEHIQSECGNRRPDIRIECEEKGRVIFVEVDENQHRSYDASCECARLSEIVGDCFGQCVTFIRFNPDKFKLGGVKEEYPGGKRFELLVRVLLREMDREIGPMEIKLIQLFYDTPEGVDKYRQTEIITDKFTPKGKSKSESDKKEEVKKEHKVKKR